MKFNSSIIDTIKKRKSVRTFSHRPIEEATYKKIRDYIDEEENLVGPLGCKVKFQLIPVNKNVTEDFSLRYVRFHVNHGSIYKK